MKLLAQLRPEQTLIIGYLFYALIGWLLLAIPVSHVNQSSIMDTFFTAISAVSTTGLATVDIGTTYSFWGHLIILCLIQIGGIGYMTIVSFVFLATGHKLFYETEKMTAATFLLPDKFTFREFITQVIVFTTTLELLGAIALSIFFKYQGIENPIWNGIFHSISAFCTAGFCLFPDGFIQFQYNLCFNLMISVLSIAGALGFIVWFNFYKIFSREKLSLIFTTKVILSLTFSFIVIGSLTYFFLERVSGSSKEWTLAFFQTISAATTTGFNTVDIGHLKEPTLVLLFFLMVFGASPSGTGGGLKNNTFSALVGLVKSTIKGREAVSFWLREIPPKRLQIATATLAYYGFVLIFAVFWLSVVEEKGFLSLLFEAASALGATGLSMGITADLTALGKGIICLLMLMGRVGILSFGLAISRHEKKKKLHTQDEEDTELVF